MDFDCIDNKLFFSKNDPLDLRLGDFFRYCSLKSIQNDIAQDGLTKDSIADSIAILGYPDDLGIQINGGRLGAQFAPDLIRQFLYKMTWPLRFSPIKKYLDFGNLKQNELTPQNQLSSLAQRHEFALNNLLHLYSQKFKIITLGGGHDYGYPDAAAFAKNFISQVKIGKKPVIINFDAHLDVRPSDKGFHSGTPFYRILNEFEDQIDFIEIGIQPQCNSTSHKDWAISKKAHIFTLQHIVNNSLNSLLNETVFQKLTPDTPVFISFDIDCLSSSDAGGCSQAWATGLKIQETLDFLNQLYQRFNCRGLGIYEVSPPLDTDFRTSKAAALLAYNFIFHNQLNEWL